MNIRFHEDHKHWFITNRFLRPEVVDKVVSAITTAVQPVAPLLDKYPVDDVSEWRTVPGTARLVEDTRPDQRFIWVDLSGIPINPDVFTERFTLLEFTECLRDVLAYHRFHTVDAERERFLLDWKLSQYFSNNFQFALETGHALLACLSEVFVGLTKAGGTVEDVRGVHHPLIKPRNDLELNNIHRSIFMIDVAVNQR